MLRRLIYLFGFKRAIRGVYVEENVQLDRCEFIGPVRIGYRSYANFSLFRNVSVGRYCSIGRRCTLGAAKHHIVGLTTSPFGAPSGFESDVQTKIGNDVWIGDNVVVVAGVEVGDGAIIGAGSIVTHDVPPYTIVAGVPARPLRPRFDEDVVSELTRIAWWRFGDAPVEMFRDASIIEFISRFQVNGHSPLEEHHGIYRRPIF
ncbi:hypothetical protein B7G68_02620 [Caulobacter segnis]|uniref:Acetyltransferase (Isoleucine patch superfamily)-like protein n=2 Tax=Caulobacter segnis TaxID=88688 RepID=D5VHP2_CAUST|nr:DapH/DapD/GlmU-related protein [Caulobacter segnis]ADG09023.1 Acetyltransferase (isoleucine patch superfamily)-like protein [Caulobacter segnis ATCC 21756]AVQ00851.1 hypothetical protein B7G68_02620 [Caulobacter segnis]